MNDLVLWVWLGGWVAAAVGAAFIGGAERDATDPPLFFWPLFFGWFWPAFVGVMIVMGALEMVARLGDRLRREPSHDR